MGLVDLPYHACQLVMRDEILLLRDRRNIKNHFGW